MNSTALSAIRNSKGFSRGVVLLVIIALVGLVLERTIYYSLHKAEIIAEEDAIERLNRIAPYKAKQLGLPTTTNTGEQKPANDTLLSESVVKTQDALDVLAYELNRDGDTTKAQDALDKLYAQMLSQDKVAMADFDTVADHIKQHQLPDVIQERHEKAVEHYRDEMNALLFNLQEIKQAKSHDEQKEAVKLALKHLEDKQLKRTHQKFDPQNMPHKTFKPKKDNAPKVTPSEFVQAGLHNTPYTQYAALGDFTYSNLAGASDPAYQAETTEVKITQAIRDQAEALNYDPVQIYYWVRNNIEWMPTWGAMQDADITLGSGRGNAMDISSLLIALLRASQIPARYTHGTIDVPSDKFQNWVDPFTDILAAIDMAAVVPLAAVVEAGNITKIRMEHIWVEAAIDFQPSRGEKNIDADSWVALDASFKQYEDLTGLDVASVTSVDAESLANNFIASGLINEAEGWIRDFDPTILANAQATVQSELSSYLNANIPNATISDVVGGRRIIPEQASSLPSSLPNKVLVSGARYSEIPTSLQAQLVLALGRDIIGQPIGEVILPWAKINNRKLTLSFIPATPQDEAALLSYIPSVTDISAWQSSSLPAYLIKVIPEIKLDGEIISQGNVIGLGQEVDLVYSQKIPGSTLGTSHKPVAAGSYLTLAMFGGSVSGQRMTEVQTRISQTRAAMASGDTAQIGKISREDLLGDMFHAGMLGYYAQQTSLSLVIGRAQKASTIVLPSGGTWGYVPKLSYFFGLVRAIQPGGLEMDLKSEINVTSAWDGDAQKKFIMTQHMGVLGSALEHVIPEQMFRTPENPDEAVSAVKLISKASEVGQRIYHITQANMSTTLPNLNLGADIMSDIYAGLNAGKEVVTHTDELTVSGYTGAGYIILDPEVGDGAYMIGGGLNGSAFTLILGGLALMLLAFMLLPILLTNPIFAAVGITVFLAILVGAAAFITAGIAILNGDTTTCNIAVSIGVGSLGFAIASLPGVAGASAIINYLAFTGAVGAASGAIGDKLCSPT